MAIIEKVVLIDGRQISVDVGMTEAGAKPLLARMRMQFGVAHPNVLYYVVRDPRSRRVTVYDWDDKKRLK